ncbi:peptidoglycan-binding domain-containing protein [Leucobacter aridicollis]
MGASQLNSRRRARSIGYAVLALAALVALATGVLAGIFVSTPPPPKELEPGQVITTVPITEREFDDARDVDIGVTKQAAPSLTIDASGKLTSFTCSPGQPLASGESVLTVDGEPVISLSLPTPMWRDLSLGDSGTDATAVNDELRRLGYASGPANAVSPETLAGFNQLRVDRGSSTASGPIRASGVLWLPPGTNTVGACTKQVGDVLEPGAAVADLPTGLTKAVLTSLGETAFEGKRELVLGPEALPVPEDGVITDPQTLQKISLSTEYSEAAAESDSSTVEFTAKWRLATAAAASVIPPSPITNLHDGTGCVLVDGHPQGVTVVGSELGQTFVTFEGEGSLGLTVTVAPPATTKCE